MRIIGGDARRGKLTGAREMSLRPITNRLKESLFAILDADVSGSDVLDLYAGSGSLGIECLSRRARSAVFVDSSKECLRAIEKNLERFNFAADVYNIRVEEAVGLFAGKKKTFDIVFAEPPFSDTDFRQTVFPRLGSVTSDGGVVVLRCHWRAPFPDESGLLYLARQKRCGENKLLFYRRHSQVAKAGDCKSLIRGSNPRAASSEDKVSRKSDGGKITYVAVDKHAESA